MKLYGAALRRYEAFVTSDLFTGASEELRQTFQARFATTLENCASEAMGEVDTMVAMADRGIAPAARALGKYYGSDLNPEQDLALSRHWYARAAELERAFAGKLVLGLRGVIGIPERPEGPSLACRVRVHGDEVQVQLSSSDAAAEKWVAAAKFTIPLHAKGPSDPGHLADEVVEGLLSRVVRAQLVKGPRQKGKLTYRLRIDNGDLSLAPA